MPTDQAEFPSTDATNLTEMAELDESAIAAVAGGLNPQPLPPGRAFRFD